MLRKILLVLAILLVAFAVFVQTRPSTFSVERTVTIAVPADRVFPHVNDFKAWDAWSPWARLDPAMKKSTSGAAAGVGAVYEWQGNDDVGKGRMTITESVPNQKVEIRLEFLEPWAATNQTIFVFKPKDGSTDVTWIMRGRNDFFGKLIGLFMDMDAMVGKDFEQGLAKLRAVAEGSGIPISHFLPPRLGARWTARRN